MSGLLQVRDRISPGTPPRRRGEATGRLLAIGVGLGFVGPPAMGSRYRTLPSPLVPQGSSVLYMLNQLGASIGIAVVALILETAGDPMAGYHGVYWFVIGAVLVILAGSTLLPGRLTTPSPTINTAEVPAGVAQGDAQ